MTGQLDGKVAVITGGAAGIGLATARLFLAEGASVMIGDLQEGGAMDLIALNPGRCGWRRTDVLFEDDVASLIAEAESRFGGLDVLYNNAGYGGTIAPVDELNFESVDRSIGVLLRGVICGYKHGVAAMKRRGGGSIISTASVAGMIGGGAPLIYSTCKAAVIHLARSAAVELAPLNIRSNAICPGSIATQLLSRAFGVSKEEAEPFRAFLAQRAAAGQRIPLIGQPEDIAKMALFLASDASVFVSGQAIAVDGSYAVNPAVDHGQRAALIEALKAFRASRAPGSHPSA
ncbi:MAG TPA: SDR family oxidoreductase [Caulobacteraceae bacterium]|jgi:NAD(P)-dependent dehydrogenase (short-subunit alcohol dehydrogenase family)|nr:SDR family oxidoreductase [Caulobacteraceae bacterium]